MLDATSYCRYENLFMFTCDINEYVDMKPILANIHLSYVDMRDKYICKLFMLTPKINMLTFNLLMSTCILVLLTCEIIIFTKQTEQLLNNDEYLINLILYQ